MLSCQSLPLPEPLPFCTTALGSKVTVFVFPLPFPLPLGPWASTLLLLPLSLPLPFPLSRRSAVGGKTSSGPVGKVVPDSRSNFAFNFCKIRMEANFWGDSWSQYIPFGLGNCLFTRMVRVGVQMMSTGTSWINILSAGISSTSWQSWMQVTTGVSSSMAPMTLSIPYSSSAKPSPFPKRAPFSGFTATDPMTMRSIFKVASKSIGWPYCTTPCWVAANRY
mmetsp:Transcript_87135/g.182355  ORF Transcript_87135/g.182355 Transcript_87135/m.182355 type:complete len:221 (+) Transcript_87135:154-816(+)